MGTSLTQNHQESELAQGHVIHMDIKGREVLGVWEWLSLPSAIEMNLLLSLKIIL